MTGPLIPSLQAYIQGYSVFVIEGELNKSEADQYAEVVPEPPADQISTSKGAPRPAKRPSEEDDDDLQRAIKASLAEYDDEDTTLNAAINASIHEASSSTKPKKVDDSHSADELRRKRLRKFESNP